MSLTLEIVTPDEKVFSDTVATVVLPTIDGEIGILPGHRPLMTIIEPGELKYEKKGQTHHLAVDKGFVRVLGDTVSVLAEAAIDVEAIDLSAVTDAEDRATKALEEARKKSDIDPEEIERLEATSRFAIAQKLVKNKKL